MLALDKKAPGPLMKNREIVLLENVITLGACEKNPKRRQKDIEGQHGVDIGIEAQNKIWKYTPESF